VDNIISFKELGNNWYEGKLIINGRELTLAGTCDKNPSSHLHSAYLFFARGGMRAQCVFNEDTTCHLIVMRRADAKTDNIIIEVVKLNEKFENNAKLRSNDYLDSNIVFSASVSLALFASAIGYQDPNSQPLH